MTMNEKNIILRDKMNLSDSKIRGHVYFRNENGDIIFSKENMIVASGREYIRNVIFSLIDTSATETRKINKVMFGKDQTMPAFNQEVLLDPETTLNLTLTSLVWKKNTDLLIKGYSGADGSTDPANQQEGTYFMNISSSPVLKRFDGVSWIEQSNLPVGTYFLSDDEAADERKLYQSTDSSWTVTTTSQMPEVKRVFYSINKELLYEFDPSNNTWTNKPNLVLSSFPLMTGYSESNYFYNTSNSNFYVAEKGLSIEKGSTENEIFFKVSVILRGGSNSVKISEMGLFLDGAGEKMFSRLSFNPITVSQEFTYYLDYYIYF